MSKTGVVQGTNTTRLCQVPRQEATPMVYEQVPTILSTQQAIQSPKTLFPELLHRDLTRCTSPLRHRPTPLAITRQQSRPCGHYRSESPVRLHPLVLTTMVCGHFQQSRRPQVPVRHMGHVPLQSSIHRRTTTVTPWPHRAQVIDRYHLDAREHIRDPNR